MRNERLKKEFQKLAYIPRDIPEEDIFPPEEPMPELTPYLETVEKPPWKPIAAAAALPFVGYYGYKGAKRGAKWLSPKAGAFFKAHPSAKTPATLAAVSVGTTLMYLLLRLGERSRSTQRWYEKQVTGVPRQHPSMRFET